MTAPIAADPERHNWECQCGHTNYAIDRICRGCMTSRARGEAYRHVGGPRWIRWTREHQGGKVLSGPVSA